MKMRKLGLIDEFNIKPGRLGGFLNSIGIVDYCFENSIDCWIGGMFETGIGRSANIRFASYLSGGAIHDLSPPNRYFQEDIVTDPIEMNDGIIDTSSVRIVSVNEEFLDRHTVKKIIL